MSNSTKEKLKAFPFERMSELEARSNELKRRVFDMFEHANHVREYLQDERFKNNATRYHSDWNISLQEQGKTGPFVSAKINADTTGVSAILNKDLLDDISNLQLVEPLVGTAIRSIDQSFRSVYGLGMQFTDSESLSGLNNSASIAPKAAGDEPTFQSSVRSDPKKDARPSKDKKTRK